jgi:lysyl-tRNA synthetase class 2
MLEFYTAYKDVNWMMDFCEEMVRRTVQAVVGGTTVRFGNEKIDFGRKFERLTMKDAILKYWPSEYEDLGGQQFDESWLNDPLRTHLLSRFLSTVGVSIKTATILIYNPSEREAKIKEIRQRSKEKEWPEALQDYEHRKGLNYQPEEETVAGNIATIFEEIAETLLSQPTLITDFPKPISPLSKASPDDLAIAERFELYVAGMEVANGFSELNDPAEQLERFEEQARQRERGDEEAMQMDLDYVRALSYGMPPAAGIGIGVDRLTMLLTNRRSIRDVILFPHMRPQKAAEEQSSETEKAEGASSEL